MHPVYEVTLTQNTAVQALTSLDGIDWEAPLRESNIYMERITLNRFARETDPDGRPWTPLKPSTLKQKKSGTILREKSILVNATSSRVVGDTGYIENPTSYGGLHQRGTKFLPKREFLGFGRRDIARINTFFRKHIERQINA